MMTTNEMKNIMVQKFKEENCCFTFKDISIKKVKNDYHIIIKDYEHIPFKMTFEIDDYFGYIVWVSYKYDDMRYKIIEMIDSKKDYDIKSALIHLGYYIASRF